VEDRLGEDPDLDLGLTQHQGEGAALGQSSVDSSTPRNASSVLTIPSHPPLDLETADLAGFGSHPALEQHSPYESKTMVAPNSTADNYFSGSTSAPFVVLEPSGGENDNGEIKPTEQNDTRPDLISKSEQEITLHNTIPTPDPTTADSKTEVPLTNDLDDRDVDENDENQDYDTGETNNAHDNDMTTPSDTKESIYYDLPTSVPQDLSSNLTEEGEPEKQPHTPPPPTSTLELQ